MKIFLVLAVIALSWVSAQAGTGRPQLVRLHQVTREEYNELMRLTNEKSEVPEGRLISSSIAGLKGLASGFTAGNFIPSIFSSGTKSTNTKKGYPLCVITANNVDLDDDDDTRPGRGRSLSVSYEPNDDTSSDSNGSGGRPGGGRPGGDRPGGGRPGGDRPGGGRPGGGRPGGGGGSDNDNDDDSTTVNCILVVKKPKDSDTRPSSSISSSGSSRPSDTSSGDSLSTSAFNGPFLPPPQFIPPYSNPYSEYYPYSPYGPPPPSPYLFNQMDDYEGRSLDAPQDVSHAIDAYNSYYGYPEYQAFPYRKRSRSSQDVSAYQPAAYPQLDYASNYPKVQRNYGLTHPAPVYVKSPQFDKDE